MVREEGAIATKEYSKILSNISLMELQSSSRPKLLKVIHQLNLRFGLLGDILNPGVTFVATIILCGGCEAERWPNIGPEVPPLRWRGLAAHGRARVRRSGIYRPSPWRTAI